MTIDTQKKQPYKGRHQIINTGSFWMVGFWVFFFLLICIFWFFYIEHTLYG